MAKDYDNTNRGALFRVDDKESEKHPDYSGNINAGGKDFWLSAWIKVSKDGQKYMSLSVTPKDKAQKGQQSSRQEVDSDVPF
jgi:uncharacterized protein (DUF736 family)